MIMKENVLKEKSNRFVLAIVKGYHPIADEKRITN